MLLKGCFLKGEKMSGYEFFDRQYRFSAGPAGQKGFELGETSSSQPIPLHVNFSFQKADLETANNGKVEIWNLNLEHLEMLNKDGCCVSMKAGYGSHLSLIFAGRVSYATTVPDGADRKTEIEVVDTLVEISDTNVSLSYKGKVNWRTIMDDTAKQMGVAVSYSYNMTFADIPNGFSYVGKAKNVFSKGCACCGATWSIQNGVLQIKKKGDTMSREVYVLSADSGLIGIPQRVVVAENEETGKNDMGWDVEYLLNGAINVDDFVKLESKVITGFFRVYSVEISGDNISGDWLCKARLLEAKG